jgi:uncharacterized protein
MHESRRHVKMHLAPKLKIPNIATETQGVIGKRGMGKSTYGVLCVEELLDAKVQTIVLDPTGGWWGLRAGRDGKPAGGYPIPIFGGYHADMPLEERGGAVLAEYVVENRLSCVLDLSAFSKSAMRRFVRDFAEKLYTLKGEPNQRAPVHVVIDECDLFVPQNVDTKDMLPLVGAVYDLSLRGRQRGIGVTLISQRPARINKDVLTQIEILVTFRLTGPQDIDAFAAWIKHNGTKEEQAKVLSSLSSLPRGTGWFWAPGLMDGMLECVAFRDRKTFDSSRTPDGKKVKPPKTLADVDLGALSEAMKATVEQAKANDPKVLKAEIEKLRRAFAEARAGQLAAEARETPKAVSAISKKDMAAFESSLKRIESYTKIIEALFANQKKEDEAHAKLAAHRIALIDQWSQRAQIIVTEMGNLSMQLKKTSAGVAAGTPVLPPRRPEVQRRPVLVQTPTLAKRIEQSNGETPKLGKGERRAMAAIAQHGDEGVTKTQLTQLTGYKRSTRNAYIARLRAAGCVVEHGERVIRTDYGIAWLGDDYEVLPTGSALLTHWLRKLPMGERKILDLITSTNLVGGSPSPWDRDTIGEELKFKRSTRNAYLARLVARRLVEEVDGGGVIAAEALFDG